MNPAAIPLWQEGRDPKLVTPTCLYRPEVSDWSRRGPPESPLQVDLPPSPEIQRLLGVTTMGNSSSQAVLVMVLTSASCRLLLSSSSPSLVSPQPSTTAESPARASPVSLLVGRQTGRRSGRNWTGSGSWT